MANSVINNRNQIGLLMETLNVRLFTSAGGKVPNRYTSFGERWPFLCAYEESELPWEAQMSMSSLLDPVCGARNPTPSSFPELCFFWVKVWGRL